MSKSSPPSPQRSHEVGPGFLTGFTTLTNFEVELSSGMMKKYGIDLVRKLCLLLEVPRSSNAVTGPFLRDTNVRDVDQDLKSQGFDDFQYSVTHERPKQDFSGSERQYKFRNWQTDKHVGADSLKAIHYP